MKKIEQKKMEIEQEFEQPLADVVRGFMEDDGLSLTQTARTLEVDRDSLRGFAVAHRIHYQAKTPNYRKTYRACNIARRPPHVRERISSGRKSCPYIARRITFRNETRCLVDWAKQIGISKQALYWRLKNGWSKERALTERNRRPH